MISASPVPLEDGSTALLRVLVITCAYSWFTLARVIPTRSTADLLLGMWELLHQLSRVPLRLLWYDEAGIGGGKRHADGGWRVRGTLATTVYRLRLHDRSPRVW